MAKKKETSSQGESRQEESSILFPPSLPPKTSKWWWMAGGGLLLLLLLLGSVRWWAKEEKSPLPLLEEVEEETSEFFPKEEKKESEIHKLRRTLEQSVSREEVLQAVDRIIQLDHPKGWEAFKLLLFKKDFLLKLTQLDFTGLLDARNRPERVPSRRQMIRLLIRKLAKSGKKEAEDILFALLDGRVFDHPSKPYWYSYHLELLYALSQCRNLRRAEAVLTRMLEAKREHPYWLTEKYWILMALRRLNTPSARKLVLDYLLSESRSEEEVLRGVQAFIQTNDRGDIEILKVLGARSPYWKVRRICYRALAGIPGDYDTFGERITAKREKAEVSVLEDILLYLKNRLVLENHPKARATLQRAIQRLRVILNAKREE